MKYNLYQSYPPGARETTLCGSLLEPQYCWDSFSSSPASQSVSMISLGNSFLFYVMSCHFFSFFFFFFFWLHLQHMLVPRLEVELELKLRSIPQPWQHQIQATSVNYAAAFVKAGSLTH